MADIGEDEPSKTLIASVLVSLLYVCCHVLVCRRIYWTSLK